VIANVLGEEYIEPGIEGLSERPRQWWQRSIDTGMGGRGSRDLGMIKKPRVTVIGGCSFVKNNT